MDASKLYALCRDKHKDTTLEHLQKIQSVLDQIFEPGAKDVYFNPDSRQYVHNFPALTENQNAFVDSIVGLTTNANPEEEVSLPGPHASFTMAVISQSPPKRLWNGDSKPHSNLPTSILRRSDAKYSQTNASLNETLARLKHIESNEKVLRTSRKGWTNKLMISQL